MSAPLVHRARASAFAQEAEWRLDGDRLTWTDLASGQTGEARLADVRLVRLTSEPTMFGEPRRYCRLRLADGGALTIASSHFAGFARMEDRGASWRALVGPLISRIAIAAPQARFLAGSSPVTWWGSIVALLLLAGALAATLIFIGEAALTARMWTGLALVAFGLPNLWRWLRGNQPGVFDPRDPPPRLLPREAGPA